MNRLSANLQSVLLSVCALDAFVSLRLCGRSWYRASLACQTQLRRLQRRQDAMHRNRLLFVANLALETGREAEALAYALRLCRLEAALSWQELAFVGDAVRQSALMPAQRWRQLRQKLAALDSASKEAEWLRRAIKSIRDHVVDTRRQILGALEASLPHQQEYSDARVAFLKMIGDQWRYIADTTMEEKAIANAHIYYQEACNVAEDELCPLQPVVLSLALNYSSFVYDVLGDKQRAAGVAKRAFDACIDAFSCCSEDTYSACVPHAQLLRDQVRLWTQDVPDNVQTLENSTDKQYLESPQPLLDALATSIEKWSVK